MLARELDQSCPTSFESIAVPRFDMLWLDGIYRQSVSESSFGMAKDTGRKRAPEQRRGAGMLRGTDSS